MSLLRHIQHRVFHVLKAVFDINIFPAAKQPLSLASEQARYLDTFFHLYLEDKISDTARYLMITNRFLYQIQHIGCYILLYHFISISKRYAVDGGDDYYHYSSASMPRY